MFVCAQLDRNDICITVARLKGEIEEPNIIPLGDIDEWRDDLLGKKYNRETGQFIEVEPTEEEASGE